jgi:glycosyltransferase-like protein
VTCSIGIFTYSTLPRGSVVHAAALADALTDAGEDVTLYALDKDRRGFFRETRTKLCLVPAGPAPDSTALLVRQRATELATFLGVRPRHAVYHAEDCMTANGLLELRSRGFALDVVRTVHHVERFEDPELAACQERSIRGAKALFTVSRAAQNDVSREFGRKSELVSNGVDAARWAVRNESRVSALRTAMGFEDAKVILCVGGVEARKNTLRTLRAFTEIARTTPEARLLILGGATVLDHGAYRRDFEAALAALPAATRSAVKDLGVVLEADLPSYFHLANVVALPSLHEGFGLVALEALAAGVPLVASRRAPFTEFLDDDCAVLVDPLSETAITEGLFAALRDGTKRRDAGHRRASEYSWERSAQRHLSLYERPTPSSNAATHVESIQER